MDILNEKGSEKLCKPIGSYITMSARALAERKPEAFNDGASTQMCIRDRPYRTHLVRAAGQGHAPRAAGVEARRNAALHGGKRPLQARGGRCALLGVRSEHLKNAHLSRSGADVSRFTCYLIHSWVHFRVALHDFYCIFYWIFRF